MTQLPTLEQITNLIKERAEKPRHIGECTVAIESCPRLGFTAHAMCSTEALFSLGISHSRAGGVFWGQTLTRMIESHLHDGTKYIITLDYDTLFTADDVRYLFNLMENNPSIDAIASLQLGRGKMRPLFTIAEGDTNRFITKEELKQELVKIKTANFGLTIFRAKSFQGLPKPWFIPIPDNNGEWGEGRIDEDVNFWLKWAEAGKTLYMCPRIVAGHNEEVVTWPDENLNPIYQSVKEYLEFGKPINCLNRVTKAIVGTNETIKLNIGAGTTTIEGYTPIDKALGLEAYPLDYPDSSVVEIRASHILEHFAIAQVPHVLQDWCRVLRPNGTLKIAVPDFAKIITLYRNSEHWMSYLMGGQQDLNDFHKSVFDKSLLAELLHHIGLVDIKPWQSEIDDCAALEISLNLQGTKP